MRVLMLALGLAMTFGPVAHGQQPSGKTETPPAPRAAVVERDAREVRQELQTLLSKYPPELGRILKMDPTMLRNEQYLAQYPGVRDFLLQHPEIARNPQFYLAFVQQGYDFTQPSDPRTQAIRMWDGVLEGITVLAVAVLVAGTLAWLVRTMLHHRRWLRMARVQTEVHNKLLDRFAGTNELMAYVQSPAGQRFLEAAPIPVEAPAERQVAAPLTRILWSIQAGIVLVVGGVGFQYVSGRLIEEVAQGLWTIGVLAVAFGLGFILAGAFSFLMSRRLGLLDPPPAPDHERGGSTTL